MGNQDVTTHKFVAILSKKVEVGKIMNALGHMSIGLVASAHPDMIKEMGFVDYADKDGTFHKSLSKNSFVILQADNGNQIRTARLAAIAKSIHFIDFTNTMQTGTYLEQLETTRQTPEAQLDYYGIILFGKIEEVSEITRKFSLWR
ncbi:MAG: DUF2000 domain-containing protein [Candidatus Levyibacteriota bacterium]